MEKNISSRMLGKSKKLPEKTKFTLQYDSVHNSGRTPSKNGENKAVLKCLNHEETQKKKIGLALDPDVKSGRKDGKEEIPLKKTGKSSDKKANVNSSSAPYLWSGSYGSSRMPFVTSNKTRPPPRVSCDSKSAVLPVKSISVSKEKITKKLDSKSGSKVAMKGTTSPLKKSTTYPPIMKAKEAKRLSPNRVFDFRKTITPHNYKPYSISSKESEKSEKNSVEKNSEKTEPEKWKSDKNQLGDRAAEQEVPVEKSNEECVKTEIEEKEKTEKLIERPDTPEMILPEKVPALAVPIVKEPSIVTQRSPERLSSPDESFSPKEGRAVSSSGVFPQEVCYCSDTEKTSSDETDTDQELGLKVLGADEGLCLSKKTKPAPNLMPMQFVPRTIPAKPPPPEVDMGVEVKSSLEAQNEGLLNLDERIWSDLEVEIRETCEKAEFLCGSDDNSEESFSEIIEQLLSPPPDDGELSVGDISQEGKSFLCEQSLPVFPPLMQLPSIVPKSETVPERDSVENREPEPATAKTEPETTHQEPAIASESEHKKNDPEPPGSSVQEADKDDYLPRIAPHRYVEDPQKPGFFKTHDKVGFIGKEQDEEFMSFEVKQVKLYQPHESQMLFYDEANCIAAQAYLKMCGIDFDIEYRKNAEQMSPSGRVPFISSGLCIIPEFEAIVSFMQFKKFTCIKIDEKDKPAFRSLISMVVDVLDASERYICWYEEETLLNYTKPRIGGLYPFPLNYILSWKKRYSERKRLCDEGIAGKTFDMILREINYCFRNLSQRLGNNTFFFGQVSTELDALVYGHLCAIFAMDLDGTMREMQYLLRQYPNLITFATNFDKMFSLNKLPSPEIVLSRLEELSKNVIAKDSNELVL